MINKPAFIHLLHGWCSDKYDPIVIFSGQKGFDTITLYEEKHKELLEDVPELTRVIRMHLNASPVIFVHPKSFAPAHSRKCSEWLELSNAINNQP